jgi:pimeloyl-ACP methyl ester carboxylesterase
MHVLTLAGFGGTKAIPSPLLSTVRSELATYLREHKLPRATLIGHSLGGFLALWLAATEPDLVGAVVVVDSVPFLPALMKSGATVETTKAQAEMMRSMIAKSTPEAFAAQNRASLAAMITDPKNIEPIAAMGRTSDPESVATAMYEIMTTDLRPLLRAVRVPTLVLAATDAAGATSYEAQYSSLKDHRLIVAEHARHFIMLDDPVLFFARVDEVLLQDAKR